MRLRWLLLCLVGLGTLLALRGCPQPDGTRLRATDAPAYLIERALAALGGADKLARWSTGRIQYRPGLAPVAAQQTDVVFDDVFQLPGHFKRTMHVKKAGESSVTVWVVNAGKGWQRRGNAEPTDFTSDLSSSSQHQFAEAFNMARLQADGVKLEVIGAEQLDGRTVVVVRGEADALGGQVEFAFDAETALPVRSRKRIRHPDTGQQADMVTDLKDYRDVDGGKTPFRLIGRADGQPVMDLQVLEIDFTDRFPPATFGKP